MLCTCSLNLSGKKSGELKHLQNRLNNQKLGKKIFNVVHVFIKIGFSAAQGDNYYLSKRQQMIP